MDPTRWLVQMRVTTSPALGESPRSLFFVRPKKSPFEIVPHTGKARQLIGPNIEKLHQLENLSFRSCLRFKCVIMSFTTLGPSSFCSFGILDLSYLAIFTTLKGILLVQPRCGLHRSLSIPCARSFSSSFDRWIYLKGNYRVPRESIPFKRLESDISEFFSIGLYCLSFSRMFLIFYEARLHATSHLNMLVK